MPLRAAALAALAGVAVTGVAAAYQGGGAVPEAGAPPVQNRVSLRTAGTPGGPARVSDAKNDGWVTVTPTVARMQSRTLGGKGWRIDVAHTVGKNYRVTITHKGKTSTYVKKYANIDAAESGAMTNAAALGMKMIPAQVCPGNPDIIPPNVSNTLGQSLVEVQGTGGTPLAGTPYTGADSCPKWDGLYLASSLKGSGQGPWTYFTQTFSNRRILDIRVSNNYLTDQAAFAVEFANMYVAANITPIPRTPIGAWWNTGRPPTSWNGHGAVTFVYSEGWVFVYPPGSGIGLTDPDLGEGASRGGPSDEQIAYAQRVMRGEIQPVQLRSGNATPAKLGNGPRR